MTQPDAATARYASSSCTPWIADSTSGGYQDAALGWDTARLLGKYPRIETLKNFHGQGFVVLDSRRACKNMRLFAAVAVTLMFRSLLDE